MTPKYKYCFLSTEGSHISLIQLGGCFSDISSWMTKNRLKLNANKTYIIIISTSRQRNKLTRFFSTPILKHTITPLHIVHNLGVIFNSDFNLRKYVSLTCRSCFYHIRDINRICRYIALLVAKVFITSRLGC